MAVLHLLAALSELDVTVDRDIAYAHVRDRVFVEQFGARPGFGDQADEHRFRVDDHWPVKK